MTDNWQNLVFGPPPATKHPTLNTPTTAANGSAYAQKALHDECQQLANTRTGRNHQLNKAAFNIASLIDAGHLNRQQAIDALTNAAHIASTLGDHPLTDTEIRNTIESGFRGSADKVGPRTITEQPAPVTETTAQHITNSGDTTDDHTTDDRTDNQPDDGDKPSSFGTHPPQDAANFLFDTDDTTTALWGHNDDILWAEGEALMIAGGMGLGKTTLAGQIIRAQLGLPPGDVLGLPVTPTTGKILYLAMDRPRQIRRSMLRQFMPHERHHIAGRLLIRVGPPIADLAQYPALLNAMAAEADATIIYIDSLKDAAIGLSDDKVGAAYNRARQQVLADNRQICELHHNRKAIAGTTTSGSVTEVYGSTWLTSGAGSVITLTGEPGDPIIEMRHVKQPLNEIGPYRLLHNHDNGTMTIDHQTDLVTLATASASNGLTANAAASAMFQVERPSRAQIEKARYKLERLSNQGLLVKIEGLKGGAHGTGATAWFTTTQQPHVSTKPNQTHDKKV